MKVLENSLFQHLLLVVIILLLAWISSRIVKAILNRLLNKSSADLRVDPTKFYFLKNATDTIILVLALIFVFYSIPALRNIGLSLFAGAGIIAAIVGFASQQAFSNIIGGIFIVIFKPFKVGDIINVSTYFGEVEDITLRHTVIKGLENRRIVIPNSTISAETILNSSLYDEKTCVFLEIGISYEANIDQAFQIMTALAKNHPSYLDNRNKGEIDQGVPEVITRVTGFGDSSVNLRAQVWAKDPITAFNMKCDLYKSIKETFDTNGVEIPYPHRTIIQKKPN